MAHTDNTPHLLSLKVMRVSRPSLSAAWEPFYSSSPSFSAHSTASIMSLQGKAPLPGHPKTLRDLSHISEVLMLPASFGAIQLGETFSGCLSLNNEASVDIEGATLRVEMQSTTTKLTLAEIGGSGFKLTVGDTLESVVHHEIKELGQHVLACTVSYRLPPGARPPAAVAEGHDPNIQAFRKFYKFAVTNPLSVKTKVHIPRSPTALLSSTEREKVFLEVHVQNLTQDGLWLQRMRFECADGWQVNDANVLQSDDPGGDGTIFSDSTTIMQPQDMRQYIYILSPTSIPLFPIVPAAGSAIPLGRLDISWRSSYGEPGRLLTSMLSRRIPAAPLQPPHTPAQAPIPPPKQPASALPLHLQRSATIGSYPQRAQSPQSGQRPMSPPVSAATPVPYRPASPFRGRTNATGPPGTQSPIPMPLSPNPASRRPLEDVKVDLIVRSIPRESISVETPFKVAFTVTVSAPAPLSLPGQPRKQRSLLLVMQHVQPPKAIPITAAPPAAQVNTEPWSPRLPSSGFSTPSPYGTPHRGDFHDLLAQRLLVASPRQTVGDSDSDAGIDVEGRETAQETPGPVAARGSTVVRLPPPFATIDLTADQNFSRDVVFLGSSALPLPPILLSDLSTNEDDDDVYPGTPAHERNLSESTVTDSEESTEMEVTIGGSGKLAIASQEFEFEYLPLRTGFVTVGGVRVLLVEDRIVDESTGDEGVRTETRGPQDMTRTLKEWDVVGEVWVKTSADA